MNADQLQTGKHTTVISHEIRPGPSTNPERWVEEHGDSLFRTICWTCHGKTMVGDGPVSAKFVPPPDLLAQMTRERTDGYMYRYMRHGGAIMPAYGNLLSAHDAWSLVHYIRHMQKTSPR